MSSLVAAKYQDDEIRSNEVYAEAGSVQVEELAHPCTSCHDKRSNSTCKCSSTCTFLNCLQKKTNKQLVLNGALHHSDYVTKVMKRLSDQSVDPKVVLEFGFS